MLRRVDEMCYADGRHPYTELMALLPDLKPREQAEIWLQILTYCQAKPREVLSDPDENDSVREQISKMPLAEILTLIKQSIPEKKVEDPK